MKVIMELVVTWFNNSLTKVNNQDNNKPPLQKDLAKGFEKTIEGLALAQGISRDEWCQEHLQLDPSIPLDRWVEEESKELERKVLAHVQRNMEAFLGESVQEEADTLRGDGLLNDGRDLSCKEPWYSLIKVIKSTAAHQVIPEGWASLASGRERVEEDSSSQVQGDSQRADHRTAPITHSLCQSLRALDEVRNNPALNTEEADIELGMVLNKPLLEWAMKRCRKALEQDDEILNPAQQKQVRRSYESYQQSLQMWEEKTAKDYRPRAHHSAFSPPLLPTSAQAPDDRHRAETAPLHSPSEASGCYTQEEPPALQHQELTQCSIIMDSQESSLPLSPIPQRQVIRKETNGQTKPPQSITRVDRPPQPSTPHRPSSTVQLTRGSTGDITSLDQHKTPSRNRLHQTSPRTPIRNTASSVSNQRRSIRPQLGPPPKPNPRPPARSSRMIE